MEIPSIKYILLRDRVGLTLKRNPLSLGLTTKSKPTPVLRGELLEAVCEAEQPRDLNRIALVGIYRKSLHLECRTEDLMGLADEDANLLLAISCSEVVYQTFIDRKSLAFGQQLLPGSWVFVKVKGISKDLPGVLRYRGELPPNLGTWFGVELIVSTGKLQRDIPFLIRTPHPPRIKGWHVFAKEGSDFFFKEANKICTLRIFFFFFFSKGADKK